MFNFTDPSNIGKAYKGFTLLSIDNIPDYKATGVYLRHKRTGLEIYHIIKDDKENLFAFAFRTIAKDSLGTAHIMEHSTLCGSEKYPLKEPFSTLVSTSLNTFLNALTYPDKTVYPGASVVRDDYFNMLDVYADAVFFPKLDHATFIQEGHRLEMDENGKLSVQGVVYNEMKGNYSAFQQVAFSNQISAMFPDSFPAFDSGGDPLNIPDLTYQQFLDFHQKFYNPDNCLLFLYGDIPTADQLDYLNDHFMSRIEKKYNCTKDIPDGDSREPIINPEIKELQKLKLIQKSQEIRSIAPDTGATGNLVTVSWYTGCDDMEKYYLSEVVCGNDSSPLSYALKQSGLGDEASCGNFDQFDEGFFTAGLWGVKKGDEQKVYDLVQKTVEDMYKNGIDQEDIDSAVMGIDFNLREVNRYWGPFSIQLMEKALKAWSNGKPCISQLTPITSFEKIKNAIKNDKDYTRSLIKKYFIDQKVAVKFVAEPTPQYFEQRNKAEQKLIEKLEKNLDKVQLKKDLDELHAYQQHVETPEESACIPSTKLSSLDPNLDIPKTELQFVKGYDGCQVPLFVSREDTNGIFYLEVLYPFDRLAPEYFQYVPFLSNVITNMGWNGKAWDDCIAESSCIMGDVWGRTCCGTVCDVPECQKEASKYSQYNFCNRNWIGLTCKALTSQAKESLDLLSEIITTMDFSDEKRFELLAQENLAEKKANIVSGGRDLAIKRSRAMWSAHQALMEIMWGVTSLGTAKAYTTQKAKDSLNIFKYIYEESLKSGGIIHITADEQSLKKIMPMLEDFAQKSKITKLLPGVSHTLEEYRPFISQSELIVNNGEPQIISVDSQTGYAACATPASAYLTKEAAAETIFTSWFSNHTLWDKIRTSGGAYGASCWNDNCNRLLGFSTYRDPTPEKSINVYLDSLKEISEKLIPEEDIEKTIVSCYGDAIVPVCPKDRGERSFEGMLYGNPQDFRQQRINNILAVKAEDVKKAAKKLSDAVRKSCYKVVFTDKKQGITRNNINIPL